MRRAPRPAPRVWRRRRPRTKATTHAVGVAAGRIPFAARGTYQVPQELRNWACRRGDRVLIPCSLREDLHHHIRTSVRDKATPKWYRAVRVKNLTGWSEGNAAYTLWARRRNKTERRFTPTRAGVVSGGRPKEKTPPTTGGVLAK